MAGAVGDFSSGSVFVPVGVGVLRVAREDSQFVSHSSSSSASVPFSSPSALLSSAAPLVSLAALVVVTIEEDVGGAVDGVGHVGGGIDKVELIDWIVSSSVSSI